MLDIKTPKTEVKINRFVLANAFIFISPRFWPEAPTGGPHFLAPLDSGLGFRFRCRFHIQIVRERTPNRKNPWPAGRPRPFADTFSYLANLSIFYHHYRMPWPAGGDHIPSHPHGVPILAPACEALFGNRQAGRQPFCQPLNLSIPKPRPWNPPTPHPIKRLLRPPCLLPLRQINNIGQPAKFV